MRIDRDKLNPGDEYKIAAEIRMNRLLAGEPYRDEMWQECLKEAYGQIAAAKK